MAINGENSERRMSDLLDREEIRHRMYSYSRGVDRCDKALAHTVFWPDATAECGTGYRGSATGLVEWAVDGLSKLEQTMHFLGNIYIELLGSKANVETYAHCYHRVPGPNGPFDVVVALRYVDRFEKRNGEWRVAARIMLYDWFRTYDDSCDWKEGFFGQSMIPGETAGGRWPDDLSYSWFNRP